MPSKRGRWQQEERCTLLPFKTINHISSLTLFRYAGSSYTSEGDNMFGWQIQSQGTPLLRADWCIRGSLLWLWLDSLQSSIVLGDMTQGAVCKALRSWSVVAWDTGRRQAGRRASRAELQRGCWKESRHLEDILILEFALSQHLPLAYN